MIQLLSNPTRILFFTGKGGVGKTSSACATAIGLADAGKRVLLVSTDPASNLDEVLGVKLSTRPTEIADVPRLTALNIDPVQAAQSYRERVVGPYRGLLPEAAIASIEEQLSGACTVEIAAFDEFSKLLGDPAATSAFDHVIFDTAPTGHTLRLLELPAAWSSFIAENAGGTSCLGPLAGLAASKDLYAASNNALRDAAQTRFVLVTRAERASLAEAERTRAELSHLGVTNWCLLLNGVFLARDSADPTAAALEARGRAALDSIPAGLGGLERVVVPLLGFELLGIDALRKMGSQKDGLAEEPTLLTPETFGSQTIDSLIDELAKRRSGAVMTMGKGGVGKTTVAARVASELVRRGFPVTLTTTDPAAHVEQAIDDLGARTSLLRVTRIDPAEETQRYTAEVLATAGKGLDAQARALLEEDLRSPCTEELAVFRAFAETVAEGEERFVVVDTAPTGHTLLLLDAAESYHREVLRKPSGSPDAVLRLLPRLRDAAFTRIILVTLPEATPIHEAMQLEGDLKRAGITPFAWLVNQSLTPIRVTDPTLRRRRAHEARHLGDLAERVPRLVLQPWSSDLAKREDAGRVV
jgi:arsenite/tail-anchored protein-transporting ATPase